MSRGKRVAERQAVALLEKILEINKQDRDALPGSVVRYVKEALKNLLKRRKNKP